MKRLSLLSATQQAPDMQNDEQRRLDWIRGQLDLFLFQLTRPATEQIDWLMHLDPPAHAPEDIAVDFCDFAILAPQLRSAFPISEQTLGRVAAVDAAIDEISGLENAQLWTLDALANDPKWENIRNLATEAFSSWQEDGMSDRGSSNRV
jgi:hypothetical protein